MTGRGGRGEDKLLYPQSSPVRPDGSGGSDVNPRNDKFNGCWDSGVQARMRSSAFSIVKMGCVAMRGSPLFSFAK